MSETLTTGTGDTGNAYCPECMFPGVGMHYEYCPALKRYTAPPYTTPPMVLSALPCPPIPDYTDHLERMIAVLERIAASLASLDMTEQMK